jgi:hypothetical protein
MRSLRVVEALWDNITETVVYIYGSTPLQRGGQVNAQFGRGSCPQHQLTSRCDSSH